MVRFTVLCNRTKCKKPGNISTEMKHFDSTLGAEFMRFHFQCPDCGNLISMDVIAKKEEGPL